MRVVSGIQPTGKPHLGNYLGAIVNAMASEVFEMLGPQVSMRQGVRDAVATQNLKNSGAHGAHPE